MNYKIIAVDFDGTLCENKWPNIGEPNWEVINYLKKQQEGGDVKLILWTCRIKKLRNDAIMWCIDHGLSFDAVNKNLPEVIEEFGSDTRKVFAHEYIDDRSKVQFNLPFVSNGITDEVMHKIEKTFGFILHEWQWQYLFGNDEARYQIQERQCGKTFIYCIRLLLENREKFNLTDLGQGKFKDGTYGNHYDRWFANYLVELNDKLVEVGFETNLIKEFRPNPFSDLYHEHQRLFDDRDIVERASDKKWLWARGCAKPITRDFAVLKTEARRNHNDKDAALLATFGLALLMQHEEEESKPDHDVNMKKED